MLKQHLAANLRCPVFIRFASLLSYIHSITCIHLIMYLIMYLFILIFFICEAHILAIIGPCLEVFVENWDLINKCRKISWQISEHFSPYLPKIQHNTPNTDLAHPQVSSWDTHFWMPSGFCITAPAQLSATGLLYVRPCLILACWVTIKLGYTATPVACGWAGAIFELTRAFRQEQYGQRIKNTREGKMWPTDQPTNRLTDKAGWRV